MRTTALAAAVLFLAASTTFGLDGLQLDPFTLTVGEVRVTSDTTAEMDFTLTAQPGHYVYQKEMAAEAAAPAGVAVLELVMPEASRKDFGGTEFKIFKGAAKFTLKLAIPSRAAVAGKKLTVKVSYMGCSSSMCFPKKTVELTGAFGAASGDVGPAGSAPVGSLAEQFGVQGLPALRFTDSAGREYKGERLNGFTSARELLATVNRVVAGKGAYEQKPFEVSVVTLLLVFAGGLGLTLTPCVWPMIPITTGIVLGSRKPGTGAGFVLSGAYALGLAAAYAAAGAILASVGGLLGEFLQSPAVIIGVAALFVVMALSMFGLFDLPLINAGSGKLGGGSLAASFGLGAVSALVLSPCVGPVVASLLLYVAQTGRALAGGLMLFIFGLGMGLPLVVIGTFSGAMGKLPKSGRWMVEVRKLFGVVLTAFGVSRLAPLLGYRSEMILYGATAVALAAGFLVFDVRKALPSTLGKVKLVLCGMLVAAGVYAMAAPGEPPAAGGIQWRRSVAEARREAAESGKPLMLDFTADWCSACREMEHKTFADEAVIKAAQYLIPVKVDLSTPASE